MSVVGIAMSHPLCWYGSLIYVDGKTNAAGKRYRKLHIKYRNGKGGLLNVTEL